ncbi:MAG TPA: sigma-70 family RNA polymerase sigma factor [Gemmataceae bacterium]|nr:sigma-70 family RNA polymerase sigma factor [Gemmataceae bacterium]
MTRPFSSFLRHFRRQVVLRDAGEVTDRDLLQRFARERDGDAFAALVQRYGPLVLGVCCRVLRQEQDAEDAFQATFLVLARKAGSIEQPERLGNWLYGVAARVAQKARAEAARRRARQQPVTDVLASRGDPEADWEDLRQVLDDEVQRLPDKFGAPLVLCYLQGMTREEAAARLGRSAGRSRACWSAAGSFCGRGWPGAASPCRWGRARRCSPGARCRQRCRRC